jgi:integrase
MEAELWLGKERRLVTDSNMGDGAWTSPAVRSEVDRAVKETLSAYGKTVIKERKLKDRTRIGYSETFERHIEPRLGGLSIDSLTPQIVRNWYATTLVDKPTARAHAYQLLKSICNTAVTDGLLVANPCQIKGAGNVKSQRQINLLTTAELQTLADTIQPERFKALVLISSWCGLRWGETSELRRRDVGSGCETISVARGVTHRQGCHLSTPKNGKARVVVVPPHIRADIQFHLDSFVESDPDSLLFPPIRGGCHLVEKVFRDAFKAALESVGRDDVRIHDLRHFAGAQTARVGNLIETMNRLGHQTSTASLRYQHQVSGRDAEIAAALSELAAKPKLAVVADEASASA